MPVPHGRQDLRARPFPLISADRWQRPEEVLRELYENAEAQAIEAADWYLNDRRRKKAYSRALRVLAIVLAAAGGIQPIASAAGAGDALGWGYVLLGAAGACIALDHFFGLSSGWMRHMLAAQRLQVRIQRFQLDWATMNARDALSPNPEGIDVPVYLDALRAFVSDISAIMTAETAEWVAEFQSGLSQLQSRAGRPTT